MSCSSSTPSECPQYITVSGAGLAQTNGIYQFVNSAPTASEYAAKTAIKTYCWELTDTPSTVIWMENYSPYTWVLSVLGDGIYFGGGTGNVPAPFSETRNDVYSDFLARTTYMDANILPIPHVVVGQSPLSPPPAPPSPPVPPSPLPQLPPI